MTLAMQVNSIMDDLASAGNEQKSYSYRIYPFVFPHTIGIEGIQECYKSKGGREYSYVPQLLTPKKKNKNALEVGVGWGRCGTVGMENTRLQ